MTGISALIKETTVRLQLEGAFYEPGSGHSTRHKSARIMILDFPGSKAVRYKCLCL